MKRIKYTSRAKKDFAKVISFYNKLYGKEKSQIISLEIHQRIQLLEIEDFDFKKSGEVDDQFSFLNQEYRKLIHHHCKITYREGKEFIYVVRVFDTRQDPSKNL